MAVEEESVQLVPCRSDGEAERPVAFGFFLAVQAENLWLFHLALSWSSNVSHAIVE